MSRTRSRFCGLLSRTVLAAVCACAFIAPVHAGLGNYPFRVESVKGPRAIELVARNDGPGTITVHLTIYGENIASDVVWPVTRAVPAHSSVSLARLFADDPKKDTRFGYTKSLQFGDFTAPSVSATYRLPYMDGSSFYVSQAYGDPLTTHLGHASQYAVDFAMPEGTPVVAARDGVVIDVTLDFEAGGLHQDLQDKANNVVIEHDDGTVAHYAHLAKREASVRMGQRVKAGAVIGHSGNTGYSSGPHLHFAVTKPEVLADGRVGHVSIPVLFYVDTAALPFEARRGARVIASYGRDSGVSSQRMALESRARQAAPAASQVSEIPVRKLPMANVGQRISGEAAALPAVTEQSSVTSEGAAARSVRPNVSETVPVAIAPIQPAAATASAGAPAPLTEARNAVPSGNAADEGWSLLEIALAGMSFALVGLYGAYFVGRAQSKRNVAL